MFGINQNKRSRKNVKKMKRNKCPPSSCKNGREVT